MDVIALAFFFLAAYLISATISELSVKTTTILVIWAFFIRLIAFFVIPLFVTYDDEFGYLRMGADVLGRLLSSEPNPWDWNKWVNVVGAIFYAFGESLLVLKGINAMMGVIMAFMLHRVAYVLYRNERVAIVVLFVSLFLPPSILISSVALKEQVVAFLLVLVVYGVTFNGLKRWLIVAVGCGGILLFRSVLAIPVIPIMTFYLLATLISKVRLSGGIFRATSVLFVIIVLGLSFVATRFNIVQTSKVYLVLSGEDNRYYGEIANRTATFNRFVNAEDAFSPANIVLGVARSFYSPGPPRLLKTQSKTVFLEVFAVTLYLYIAVPFFLIGVWESRKKLSQFIPVFLYVIVFFSASLSYFTVAEETLRYRLSGLPLYFMIAVYGWYCKDFKYRSTFVGLWWASVLVFVLIYMYI